MKQMILTQFPWPWLPAIALIIFFTFFVSLLILVSLKSRQPILRAASELPLDDAQTYEPVGEAKYE